MGRLFGDQKCLLNKVCWDGTRMDGMLIGGTNKRLL